MPNTPQNVETIFTLPKLIAKDNVWRTDHLRQDACQAAFSPWVLAWAIQSKKPTEEIQTYMQGYDASGVRSDINNGIELNSGCGTVSLLFFAIERCSKDLITMLIEAGAALTKTFNPHRIPILGFTVLFSSMDQKDTTDIFQFLLSFGANPDQIPPDMWDKPLEPPKLTSRPQPTHDDQHSDHWCTPELRKVVASNLNLSQRYFCRQADLLLKPSSRERFASNFYRVNGLLHLPFHLVGQRAAVRFLQDNVLVKFVADRPQPLVLVFTGPSGHGKTELACSMNMLLNCELLVVDCTNMKKDTDIFGAWAPYKGFEEGSTLNNHLRKHAEHSTHNIVFLDEFEKTTREVWDNGTYTDRRDGKLIDCKKTMWVCASNHGSNLIAAFFQKHVNNKSESAIDAAPYEELQNGLADSFKNRVGSPLVGRITSIIPFFPFTLVEQAVVAHSIPRREVKKARRPANPDNGPIYGDIHLHLQNDGSLCRSIAQRGYDPDLGARSLESFIYQSIILPVVKLYIEDDEPIVPRKSELSPLQRISVKPTLSESGRERFEVYRDGLTEMCWKKSKATESIENLHKSCQSPFSQAS